VGVLKGVEWSAWLERVMTRAGLLRVIAGVSCQYASVCACDGSGVGVRVYARVLARHSRGLASRDSSRGIALGVFSLLCRERVVMS